MDLRKRAVAFVKAGGSKSEACRRFTIARETIYRWLNDIEPKKRKPQKSKQSLEKLRKLVLENPSMRLVDLAHELGMSKSNVHYHLQKMGFTFKKNKRLTPKSPTSNARPTAGA